MLHISFSPKHYGYLWVASALATLIAMGGTFVILAVISDAVNKGTAASHQFQYGAWFIADQLAIFGLASLALHCLKKYQGR